MTNSVTDVSTLPSSVIDISHYNKIWNIGDIVKEGIIGVIHKATQGSSYTDPTFETNRLLIKKNELLFGAYHFGTAGDPVGQAEHFLDIAGKNDLLVLDLEANPQGQDMSLEEAEEFVHYIYSVTGRYPGLYSGYTLKQALATARISLPEQTELSKCWLWISQYANKPVIPKLWERWTLWQHTNGAQGLGPYEVPGVGRCDRDKFNGTEEELKDFWRKNSLNN